MTRFVALYRMPADVEGFDRDYRHTHLPLVAATPGGAAFKAARGSPEWAAAGRNLAEIGGVELATMFVLEEAEVTDLSGTAAPSGDLMTD